MTRWRAACSHLGISLAIAGAVAAIVYFVWYPPPYFSVAGGSKLMLLILAVDVVIGPCLTLAVFRAGKKGLGFDLSVIALLQLVAFCYGISVIAEARPIFVVAAVDRFNVVSANQITDEDLALGNAPEFKERSWSGPRLVGATAPKDKTFELAESASSGRDIEKIPQYYVPFEQVAETLFAHAKPLAELNDRLPQTADQISHFAAEHGESVDGLLYVPLKGRLESATMVLSAKTKRPIGALDINPW